MMECPGCGEKQLRVRHTFTVHHGAQTRDLRCGACGRMTSSVTFLVDDGQPSEGRRRQKGGKHLAEQIRRDQLLLKHDAETRNQPD